MQIILLEKIANVGNLGDVVKVKDGYARNFLIPQGKAKRATPENLKAIEAQRAELEKRGRREARDRAGARREARRRDAAHLAEGRRRRPAVRLGHQRRHRRGAEGAGHRRREVDGPHAVGTAEAGRRSSGVRRAAHRRHRAHHRSRRRRNRRQLIALRCALSAALRTNAKGPRNRPFRFIADRASAAVKSPVRRSIRRSPCPTISRSTS